MLYHAKRKCVKKVFRTIIHKILVSYIQGIACCICCFFSCSLSSINGICDVLVGLNSVFGVTHLRTSTGVLHSTIEIRTFYAISNEKAS